jgi:hypothetical protein
MFPVPVRGQGVHPNAQLSPGRAGLRYDQIVATKDHKRHARGLLEALEFRMHVGPPIHNHEIHSAREFLRQNDFAPASEYFNRLAQIQSRLETRSRQPTVLPAKRNYGGEAGGYWMQLQSTFDHVILSTCYEGEFNFKRGRVKVSHRFNQNGRIDFVELKFLRPLEPCLLGELRKLVLVRDYQHIQKDWHNAEAFVLPVLPRELVFLYGELFRCPKNEILAWLINIGHRSVGDLLDALRNGRVNGFDLRKHADGNQLALEAVRTDEVALPILRDAAALESTVEVLDPKTADVRYASR